MPRKDGTGPKGKGSKTGRQMGKCSGAKPSASCGCEVGKKSAKKGK